MATKTILFTAATIADVRNMSFTRTGTGAEVECNLSSDNYDLQVAALADVLPSAQDRSDLLALLNTILVNMQTAAGYVP